MSKPKRTVGFIGCSCGSCLPHARYPPPGESNGRAVRMSTRVAQVALERVRPKKGGMRNAKGVKQTRGLTEGRHGSASPAAAGFADPCHPAQTHDLCHG